MGNKISTGQITLMDLTVKAIDEITYKYKLTNNDTTPDPDDTDWQDTLIPPTASQRYLWQLQTITYTGASSDATERTVNLLSVYGEGALSIIFTNEHYTFPTQQGKISIGANTTFNVAGFLGTDIINSNNIVISLNSVEPYWTLTTGTPVDNMIPVTLTAKADTSGETPSEAGSIGIKVQVTVNGNTQTFVKIFTYSLQKSGFSYELDLSQTAVQLNDINTFKTNNLLTASTYMIYTDIDAYGEVTVSRIAPESDIYYRIISPDGSVLLTDESGDTTVTFDLSEILDIAKYNNLIVQCSSSEGATFEDYLLDSQSIPILVAPTVGGINLFINKDSEENKIIHLDSTRPDYWQIIDDPSVPDEDEDVEQQYRTRVLSNQINVSPADNFSISYYCDNSNASVEDADAKKDSSGNPTEGAQTILRIALGANYNVPSIMVDDTPLYDDFNGTYPLKVLYKEPTVLDIFNSTFNTILTIPEITFKDAATIKAEVKTIDPEAETKYDFENIKQQSFIYICSVSKYKIKVETGLTSTYWTAAPEDSVLDTENNTEAIENLTQVTSDINDVVQQITEDLKITDNLKQYFDFSPDNGVTIYTKARNEDGSWNSSDEPQYHTNMKNTGFYVLYLPNGGSQGEESQVIKVAMIDKTKIKAPTFIFRNVDNPDTFNNTAIIFSSTSTGGLRIYKGDAE